MSNNWGFVCKTHDPPIESEHWFNHGDDLLELVYLLERSGKWPNIPIGDPANPMWWEPVAINYLDFYVTNAPIEWLRAHPTCEIWLTNEYSGNGSEEKKMQTQEVIGKMDVVDNRVRAYQQRVKEFQELIQVAKFAVNQYPKEKKDESES